MIFGGKVIDDQVLTSHPGRVSRGSAHWTALGPVAPQKQASARGDSAVSAGAVGMVQRALQNVGKGGDAAVRMREGPIGIGELTRGDVSRRHVIQEHDRPHELHRRVGDGAGDGEGPTRSGWTAC